MSDQTKKVDLSELLKMDNILAWIEATDDDRWMTEVCGREADGVTKYCVRGHLLEYGEKNGYGPGFDDLFHEAWATEFMYYGVNDGRNTEYPQATPKERVMAYFRDLRDGKKLTTYQSMEAEMQAWNERNKKP